MTTLTWRDAAAERLVDAFNQQLPMDNLLQRGVDAWAARTMPGMLEGLVESGLHVVRELARQNAVAFKGDAASLLSRDFEIELNLGFARTDYQRVGWLLSVLASALGGAARTGRGKVTAVRLQHQQQIKATEPPKSSEPLRVVIEGMPERITTGEILRNDAGDIVTTLQTEKDAALA